MGMISNKDVGHIMCSKGDTPGIRPREPSSHRKGQFPPQAAECAYVETVKQKPASAPE